MRNIILVGFMGSGKSLTSYKLAKALNRPVVSTDELIVNQEGRSITDIFRDSGEVYFRKIEKDIVKEASEQSGIILDCGGGVVLDPENMANLKKNGLVIYLSAPPARIYANIKDQTNRPLLNVEDPQAKITELLDARETFYKKADIIIDADKTIDKIAEDILKAISNE